MIRRGPGVVTGDGSDLVSVVVPVCNEESNVPPFRERLTAALAGHDFECIFVDDGSTDATPALVRDIAREDPRVKLVSLSRNFGHQAAIFAGLTFARGACVAVLDGDLQDPPELIPEMVRPGAKGADVVYGVHTSRKEGWLKRTAAAIFYRLQTRVTRTKMPLDSGDFAVMSRRVVDLIVSIGERHPYVRGLRSWVGFRQVRCRRLGHRAPAPRRAWPRRVAGAGLGWTLDGRGLSVRRAALRARRAWRICRPRPRGGSEPARLRGRCP